MFSSEIMALLHGLKPFCGFSGRNALDAITALADLATTEQWPVAAQRLRNFMVPPSALPMGATAYDASRNPFLLFLILLLLIKSEEALSCARIIGSSSSENGPEDGEATSP